MSVKIRLTRIGRHESPIYRIVVCDSRSARDGKFIEQIGQYNPALGKESLVVNEVKALEWLSKGATPSDTIKSLFSSKGIIAKHAALKTKKGE